MVGGVSLEALRRALADVDRDLLALVARRQALAAEIGETKRREGRPTRDFGQEREVLGRARASAAALGVSPDLAEQLLLVLIRSSLTVQEQDQVASTGGGSGRRVLVIGGGGKMGGWMARFLQAQGFVVEVADPAARGGEFERRASWDEGALDHDLVVVATPLRVSNEILTALAARRPPGIVFDIGSLKSPLRPGFAALAAAGVRATSIHPMFGPGTELLSGRHVVFVDLGSPEATAAVRALFASTMATQVEMTLEEHDRLIATILGLSHALNIAFFTALAESGEDASKLARLSSTTFDGQLGIAGAVADENPHLYFEIQALNDFGGRALDALLRAVERLREAVRAGDEAAFVSLMERGREHLRGLRRVEGAPRPGPEATP
ncbi:MAG TPA: bifunctional chorismate mutase/prephenate dehydrogenase [Candidatus Eisenbacteria bacterium]